MTDTEKLYETLGELLYVVAMADGVIQEEEKEVLQSFISKHPFAKEIKWSFDYEQTKNANIDELYQKVITVCHRIGPSPIYTEFIETMNDLAEAAEGVDNDEADFIDSFSRDLISRFSDDIKKLK